MSHPADKSPLNAEDSHERKPRSTWLIVGVAVVLLFGALAGGLGGLGAWLVVAGLLLLLTAGYAMLSRRQSWARLKNPKLRKAALATGAGALVLGGALTAVGAPAPSEVAVEDSEASPTSSPSSSAPSPTEESIANQTCTPEASSRMQGQTEFLCTLDNGGELVWMEKATSEQLTEARKAAAEQAAAEAEARAEADRQAAEEAQRQAAEAAEAQRLADEAAAAEAQRQAADAAEAQRLADEAAAAEAQRQAEEQEPVPNPGNVTYENCSEARAAGGAPVYAGGPGYGPHLDRDGDGVGCE